MINRAPIRITTNTMTKTKTKQLIARMVMRTFWNFSNRVSWKDVATFRPRREMLLWEAGFEDFVVMELVAGSW